MHALVLPRTTYCQKPFCLCSYLRRRPSTEAELISNFKRNRPASNGKPRKRLQSFELDIGEPFNLPVEITEPAKVKNTLIYFSIFKSCKKCQIL